MCKEGIRIGRRTQTVTQRDSAAGGDVGAITFRPNSMRVGITITGYWNPGAINDLTGIAVPSPVGWLLIGAVSPGNPTLHMSVEEYGQAVTGGFTVYNQGSSSVYLFVTEHILTESLEKL